MWNRGPEVEFQAQARTLARATNQGNVQTGGGADAAAATRQGSPHHRPQDQGGGDKGHTGNGLN